MAKCIYCEKAAGFLRKKHPECEVKNKEKLRLIQEGSSKITIAALNAIKGTEKFGSLETTISEIEKSHSVSIGDRKTLLIKSWENAVEDFLSDGILEKTEENRLMDFKEHFFLSQDDLNKNGTLTKTTQAAIVRDILNGLIPERVKIDGNLPINFQKDEKIVWVFHNSKYLEDKTRRQYVGGSQGVSVRIAKGVYYRTSSFKGHAVEYTERVHLDTGLLVITNKNIYFAGSKKSLRLPYGKIVSFEPYGDGIGIMRDAATAKPQTFVTGDGWFTYNIVINLAQQA